MFYSSLNSDEKLPSVYADVRGKLVVDWIKEQTAGATFCRRSDQVKEVEGGKMWFIVLTFFIYFLSSLLIFALQVV